MQSDKIQVGSISYLRDTVVEQNKSPESMNFEIMANPVEMVGRRDKEETKTRDSFVAEDSREQPVNTNNQNSRAGG